MFGFSENTTGIPGVVFWMAQGTACSIPTVRISNLRSKRCYYSEDCFAVSIPTHKFSPVVVGGEAELPEKLLTRVLAFVQHNRSGLLGIWAGSVLPDEVTFIKV
jgi:hypothetical protein